MRGSIMTRLAIAFALQALLVTNFAGAQSPPKDYRSKNFLVHTDLPKAEAEDLLKRLETMLGIISRYWGRPNRQTIECFVVDDLKNWPSGALSASGLRSVQNGAGVTTSSVLTQGNRFLAKAVVYAVADRGTPQHEAVHAYCAQSFGTTGPVWYSEGMAEMGQYWKDGDSAVNCHDVVIKYLKKSKPKSLNEIVNGTNTTGDSWQNYAWRWTLCHLLANNKNYQQRFRPLGLELLTKTPGASFERTYGTMSDEIVFEYKQFHKHLGNGYRVDLCSWDWKAKFRTLRPRSSAIARVTATNGWQPSRVFVKSDEKYTYSASGSIQMSKSGEELTADGDKSGSGRLMGVVFEDYELSEPFELGASGEFTPPRSGKLFLRCRDAWNQLADNSGRLTVRITGASSTP